MTRIVLDYLYTKKVADVLMQSMELNSSETILKVFIKFKSFYNSGYKADKVILRLSHWERQVYVGEDESLHWTQNIASVKKICNG